MTVDGREMFLDPATPFCPMGLVHWVATDAPFIRAFGSPGKIERTPLDPPERSARRGEFDLRLDGAGGLGGTASLTCTGQEALRLRLENLGADEAGIRKKLEEKMAALLPEGGEGFAPCGREHDRIGGEPPRRLRCRPSGRRHRGGRP